MKAIKVKNAPKSMVTILVEYGYTFVFNYDNVLVIGTGNTDKFKSYMVKNGMSQEEVNILSLETIEIERVSDVYDLF